MIGKEIVNSSYSPKQIKNIIVSKRNPPYVSLCQTVGNQGGAALRDLKKERMFKKLTKSLNPELEPNTQGSNLNKLLHELKQQIRNNSPPHPIPKITSQFQAKPAKRILGQQPQIKYQQRDEFYQLSIVDSSIKTKKYQASPHMQPVVKQATQREIVIDQVDPSPGATSITHRSLSSASSDSFLPELDRSLLVSSRRQSNASTQNEIERISQEKALGQK
ncbi:hypothetical protein FGO68_gene957 [Halteria grandinella]|uniref:Uncharacterized protein n=1 Tax=Halteria grandinella TaxID=5974 RepID=A0A8J8NDM2_HALGN|nr:hypothetical protein FGO68_gene957 [Halteria grandinella]